MAELQVTIRAVDEASANLAKVKAELTALAGGHQAAASSAQQASSSFAQMGGVLSALQGAASGVTGEAGAMAAQLGGPVATAFQSMRAGVEQGADALGKFQIAGAAAAVAVVAIAGVATEMAMGYESATVSLQNFAGISTDQAKAIGSSMLDMSTKSEFGARTMMGALTPVAGRLETLTGAQLTAATSTAFMKDAMDLAEASGSGLAGTASTLTNVMLAYKIPVDEASTASDALFNTVAMTGMGLDELGSALTRLHARLGVAAPSLVETGALIADLQAHGITGSRGLMAISAGFQTLLSGAPHVDKMLNDLGVSVFDADGKFVGVRETMARLAPVLNGLTERSRVMAERTLFGASAAAQLDETLRAGAGTYDIYAQRIGQAGTAAKAAAADDATFEVQMKMLRNAIEALLIEIGQKLLPVVASITGFFRDNAAAAKALEVGAIALGVVLVALAAGFVLVQIQAAIAFVAMNAALLGIPLLIMAIVAALYLLIDNWDAVWGAMEAAPEALLHFFRDHWSDALLAYFTFGISAIWQNWSSIWDNMPGPVTKAMNAVLSIVNAAVNAIIDAINFVIKALDKIHVSIPGWVPGIGGKGFGVDIPEISNVGPWTVGGGSADYGSAIMGSRADRATMMAAAASGPGAGTNELPGAGGGKGGAHLSAATALAERNLEALAAAFDTWSAQTHGSVTEFEALLKVGADKLALDKRQHQVAVDLAAAQMEAQDSGYQLRKALVEIAADMVKTGRTLTEEMEHFAQKAYDSIRSAFNSLNSMQTKEGAQLQLRIDLLQQQKDQAEAAGAGKAVVDAIQKQIDALNLQKRLMDDNNRIQKDLLEVADQTLPTEREKLLMERMYIAAMGQQSHDLQALKSQVFLEALARQNLINAMNGAADALRGGAGVPAVPHYAQGTPYVPRTGLAVVHQGERIIPAGQHDGTGGGTTQHITIHTLQLVGDPAAGIASLGGMV